MSLIFNNFFLNSQGPLRSAFFFKWKLRCRRSFLSSQIFEFLVASVSYPPSNAEIAPNWPRRRARALSRPERPIKVCIFALSTVHMPPRYAQMRFMVSVEDFMVCATLSGGHLGAFSLIFGRRGEKSITAAKNLPNFLIFYVFSAFFWKLRESCYSFWFKSPEFAASKMDRAGQKKSILIEIS